MKLFVEIKPEDFCFNLRIIYTLHFCHFCIDKTEYQKCFKYAKVRGLL